MIGISRIHCHICPLKELCHYAESEGSWRKSRLDRWRELWDLGSVELPSTPPKPTEPTDDQLTRIRIATANCPLKKALEAKP